MGTGDVGFSSWPLERRAVWIRSERINHVFHVVLIQQHEGHLLSEWPAEYSVILTTHDNKGQGDMCASPHAVSIQIYAFAHFVPVATCVEARPVEGNLLPIDCFASFSSISSYFPRQLTVVTQKLFAFFTYSSKSASVTFLRASACSMDSFLCSDLLELSFTLSSCLLRLAASRLDSINQYHNQYLVICSFIAKVCHSSFNISIA